MHELGIASEILEAARAAIAGHPGLKVSTVRVSVGGLEAVDPDSLAFAFKAVANGDPACSDAQLEIRVGAVSSSCSRCGWRGPEVAPPACPDCGFAGLRIDGGFGLVLESIEGDDPKDR